VITICDVAPRDGLQNEAQVLPIEARTDLVHRLAAAGLPRIEAVSFVDDRRVPQMSGAEAIVEGVERRVETSYSGLVLNEKGYDRFAQTSLDAVHVALIATETFSLRNANRTLEQALPEIARIIRRAKLDGFFVSVTISAAFGCPFEGRVDPGRVLEYGAHVVEAGCDELVLADTIGAAVPRQVRGLLTPAVELGVPIGVHFHNTRNTGFANAYAALEAGVTIFDASVGGIGGCPFAPRATGNIATEDLVYLFTGEGVETGIDLDALIAISGWLELLLHHRLEGQLYLVSGPDEPSLSEESSQLHVSTRST
jgi:isopropylmalate/homocitrate/citramalate synthase